MILAGGRATVKSSGYLQFRMLLSVTTFPHRMSASDPRLEVR